MQTDLRSPITRTAKGLTVTALLCALVACSSDDDSDSDIVTATTTPDGLISTFSASGVTETIASIESTLNGIEPITVVGIVDHQANAESVGLEQSPNQVLFFGNPMLGTPLMQQNQQAGLDLPQRMHAFENAQGEVELTYNSASFLEQRHSISADTAQLETISNALRGFSEGATGSTVDDSATPSVGADEGIITVTSTRSMDETYDALIAAITGTGTLGIFRQIDHAENAASVGLDLRPTRVVMFGRPQVGTPLMVSQGSSGIDLPLKAVVYEDADGVVSIAYNDPAWIAERHNITDQDELIATITMAVGGLTATAAGTSQ